MIGNKHVHTYEWSSEGYVSVKLLMGWAMRVMVNRPSMAMPRI